MERPGPLAATIRMVLGLGNPGERYARSRHNAGFLVVSEVARRGKASWERTPLASVARLARGGRVVVLVLPTTYMNRSGEAARWAMTRWGVSPGEMLVVYDDLDLGLGRLRIRLCGGPGGHRGMLSVLEHAGTDSVPRLRVGIGRPPEGVDPVDYVLSPFGEEELEEVQAVLSRAADAVEAALSEGLEAAMNLFNPDRSPGAREHGSGAAPA